MIRQVGTGLLRGRGLLLIRIFLVETLYAGMSKMLLDRNLVPAL